MIRTKYYDETTPNVFIYFLGGLNTGNLLLSSSFKCVSYQIHAQQITCGFVGLKLRVNSYETLWNDNFYLYLYIVGFFL